MRLRSVLLCGLLLPGLQACAIHPLQQDVTHLKTVQLVDQIKCEARAALNSKIITLLQRERGHDHDLLIDKLLDNRGEVLTLSRNELENQIEKNFYDQYIDMALAFNFTFNISEENKSVAQLDLFKSFSGGSLGLGVTATGDVTRQNVRNFFVSYTFKSLLYSKEMDCRGMILAEDHVYPISGAIGLKELIDTFVDLNMRETLSAIEKQRVFADTLTFTTAFVAGGGPSARFVIAGRSLQPLDASISATASRTDVHSVIIGLSTPLEKPRSAVRTTVTRASSPLPLVGLGQRPEVTTAQEAAIQATINQRFNTFLDRFGDASLRP